MDLAEKTRLEMEAGAKQLAVVNGKPLSPEYMQAVIRTQERDAQLRRWIVTKKVKVEEPTRYQAGTVRYKRDPGVNEPLEVKIHVMPEKGGPTFTDNEALHTGGYPSEILIANIALALQAMGEL
jgi:hypothetical protein